MGEKVTINPTGVVDGSSFNTTLNNNLDTLADEFDNVLYRDGSQSMTGPLNANGQRIYNLPAPSHDADAVRLQDLEALVLAAGGDLSVLIGDTGSSLVGFIQSGTGAVASTVQVKLREWVSVKDFGAVGDGVTDDGDAVRLAIAAVAATGGAVFFPAGTYDCSPPGTGTVLTIPSNVKLFGTGMGSVIRLRTGSNANLINIAADAENVEICYLKLDGNCVGDVNNDAGATLRSSGGINTFLHHLYIYDSPGYGMGFQEGNNRRLVIDSVIIDTVMADGIDFKNDGDANNAIQISNTIVRNFHQNPLEATQAGIDIRGIALMDNIWVSDPGQTDSVGIRIRQGEALSVNGLGGHNSCLSNFRIRMSNGANQWGINAVARGFKASNGLISNAARAVYIQDSGFRGTNIDTITTVNYGFYLRATDGTLDADDTILTGCSAYSADTGFLIETDRCQLVGCYGDGNTTQDVSIASTANHTVIVGGQFRNATTKITDSGTNTKITGVSNYEKTYTVAGLSQITAVSTGQRAIVTDVNSTTFGATAVGGGANVVPVWYNGTAWKIG